MSVEKVNKPERKVVTLSDEDTRAIIYLLGRAYGYIDDMGIATEINGVALGLIREGSKIEESDFTRMMYVFGKIVGSCDNESFAEEVDAIAERLLDY